MADQSIIRITKVSEGPSVPRARTAFAPVFPNAHEWWHSRKLTRTLSYLVLQELSDIQKNSDLCKSASLSLCLVATRAATRLSAEN